MLEDLKKERKIFFSCACLHMISGCMYDYKVIKRKGNVLSMIFFFKSGIQRLIIDRFSITLFPVFEQTHWAHVACDSELVSKHGA